MTYSNASPATDFATEIKNEAEIFFEEDINTASFAGLDVEDFMSTAPLTDTGNAECFAAESGNNFRYNKTIDQWLVWNGVAWKTDKISKIDVDILSTIRHRQSVIATAPASQMGDKVKRFNYLVKCEDTQKRKSIRQAAEWLPKFVTTIEQYDTKPYLASALNGTLDLRDGSFYEAKPGDYITLQFSANYDKEADCPRWKQFLREVFSNDADLIRYMQAVIGYSLTGYTSAQKMFILYGYGKNGKTVFINTIQALAGDYAGSASFKTFDADKQSEQTNDLAMLKGKRFVSMIESAADKKLNEPLIKQVTGGDKITCRFLHKEFFDYFPQFKLFLATNHKPIITQSDFGITRRIVLIPFTQNFQDREEAGLEEKLRSELPGILNWALEGLKIWQSEGIEKLPEAIKNITDKYKKDSDTIGQWLELKTTQNPKASTQSSVAYNDYKDWANDNGFYPLGNRTFKASLEERGFVSVRQGSGIYWRGIELNSAY